MSTLEYIKRLSVEAGFVLQAVAMVAAHLRPGKQPKQRLDYSMQRPDISEFERRKATESIQIITAGMHR